jgi:SAM-dependent methyltransferase
MTPAEPDHFYGGDLAAIHDAGFTGLARRGAELAVAELARDPGEHGLAVLDVGCGGGAGAEVLYAAGLQVSGVDASADQLELARRRLPAADLRLGTLEQVEVETPFTAITAIGEVFNYFLGARPPDLDATLARCHELLHPGGLLLFDLAGPGRLRDAASSQSHLRGGDWVVLLDASESTEPAILERRITTFIRSHQPVRCGKAGRHRESGRGGECWRRDEERHRLLLYDSGQALAALGRAGFEVELRSGYGGERFAPGHNVFVARRL